MGREGKGRGMFGGGVSLWVMETDPKSRHAHGQPNSSLWLFVLKHYLPNFLMVVLLENMNNMSDEYTHSLFSFPCNINMMHKFPLFFFCLMLPTFRYICIKCLHFLHCNVSSEHHAVHWTLIQIGQVMKRNSSQNEQPQWPHPLPDCCYCQKSFVTMATPWEKVCGVVFVCMLVYCCRKFLTAG